VEECYAEDVEWQEMPSLFAPQGRRGSRAELRAAFSAATAMLKDKRVTLQHAVGSGDTVAMEVVWEATIARTVGSMTAGTRLNMPIGWFLRFRDGRIVSSHEYLAYGGAAPRQTT